MGSSPRRRLERASARSSSPSSAAKGAVVGFTRALAREAGPEGIRVNAVAPGAFPTAETEIHADQDALWRGALESQSIKRRGEVEDVARAIALFAGEDSRFVTSQALLVDGGATELQPRVVVRAMSRAPRPAGKPLAFAKAHSQSDGSSSQTTNTRSASFRPWESHTSCSR